MVELYWLPKIEQWRDRARRLGEAGDRAWDEAVALAGAQIDAVQTNALDTMAHRTLAGQPQGLGPADAARSARHEGHPV